MERGVLVQTGSWLCENSSGRSTRRNISEQLHLWESNHTAHARFDALLENCVFYISRMYEFLHSQGQNPLLPRRNIDGRFTSGSSRNSDKAAPTLATIIGWPACAAAWGSLAGARHYATSREERHGPAPNTMGT